MLDRVIFEYAIIRVVPKVEREEFINIGVIIMSQRKRFMDLKYHIDSDRLSSFSKDIDKALIQRYMKSWELISKGSLSGQGIESLDLHLRFRWLTANRSTIIQCSPVHPGLCEDPAERLVRLFKRFVL